jgi:hypothetical protein
MSRIVRQLSKEYNNELTANFHFYDYDLVPVNLQNPFINNDIIYIYFLIAILKSIVFLFYLLTFVLVMKKKHSKFPSDHKTESFAFTFYQVNESQLNYK